jgi:hypothetical protein
LYCNAEDGRQEPGKPLRSFGILGMNFLSQNGNIAVQGDVDVVNGPTFYGSSMMKYNNCFKFGLEVRSVVLFLRKPWKICNHAGFMLE